MNLEGHNEFTVTLASLLNVRLFLCRPAGRVHDYLDCLQQIKEAIEFFEGHTEETHLATLVTRLFLCPIALWLSISVTTCTHI